MSIAESDVRHIASLARVGLHESEIPTLVSQLNGILRHMDVLQTVIIPLDLSEDPSQVPMPLRADDAGAIALERTRESFAPAMREGFFLVPRLATHDTQSSA